MEDTVCQSVGWKYAIIGHKPRKATLHKNRTDAESRSEPPSARSAEPIRNEIRASNA